MSAAAFLLASAVGWERSGDGRVAKDMMPSSGGMITSGRVDRSVQRSLVRRWRRRRASRESAVIPSADGSGRAGSDMVRRSMSPIAMTVMKIMASSAVIIADVFLLVHRSQSGAEYVIGHVGRRMRGLQFVEQCSCA
ncbi:hypothetical protein WEH80_13805 [Actinomycetes bacterium KLBMP 9759]